MKRLICKTLALACGAMLAAHSQASAAQDMTPWILDWCLERGGIGLDEESVCQFPTIIEGDDDPVIELIPADELLWRNASEADDTTPWPPRRGG